METLILSLRKMVIGHWLKIRLVHLETGNKKLEHTDLSTNGNEYFLTIKTSFPTNIFTSENIDAFDAYYI